MMAAPTPTQARPETRVFRVEELIAHARAGRIRVPRFQRGFRWEREDVQKLIDSIWRGYPIGSLLLWSRPGPADRVFLGDRVFSVSEQSSAWFVVDGQQRIVSLVSTLLLSFPHPAEKFDLYFDLQTGTVVPPRQTDRPPTDLPLNRVLNSDSLVAWLEDNNAGLTLEQVRLAVRFGKALREYELPAYVVNTDDEAVVREIFLRTNATGKALEPNEVFAALHAPIARKSGRHLRELAETFLPRGFDDLDDSRALDELFGIADLPDEQRHQLRWGDIPADFEQIERTLDRVFGFLAQDAGIPHFRLLPYAGQLRVLGVYFDRFPTPSSRARRLLTRWLWRGSAIHSAATHLDAHGDSRSRQQERAAALEAVRESRSDEEAAHGILATVSAQRPEVRAAEPFDLRDAGCKLSVLALAELRPHDLRTGAPLDVVALLESSGEVVPEIVTQSNAVISLHQRASVGNRILHPRVGDEPMLSILMEAVRVIMFPSPASHVLSSHAISAEAARALRENDRVRFLELRRDQIEVAIQRLIDRHAEWDHSDRLSITALIDEDD